MRTLSPYDPLDKTNLGTSVADAMLEKEPECLEGLEAFRGAGIYAIYYTGDFTEYKQIATRNRLHDFVAPIYVGKAIPPGARKGRFGLDDPTDNVSLFRRLVEHGKSIRHTDNLLLGHFWCRFLVTYDIWIPLAEALLVARFNPLWNNLVDGFGNHDPGGGRYLQQRSRWDVLHPGRPWAARCQERVETAAEIGADVVSHLRQQADSIDLSTS